MPIIIPSKNIYHKKNNIVIDNALSKIEVEATKLSKKFTDGLCYANDEIKPLQGESFFADRVQENYELSSYRYEAHTSFCFAYVGYYDTLKWELVIYVPKSQIDKEVVRLNEIYFYENDGFSKDSLTCTIFGEEKKGLATGTLQIKANSVTNTTNSYDVVSLTHKLGGGYSTSEVEIMHYLPQIEQHWNNIGFGDLWGDLTANAKIKYKYDVDFMQQSKIEDNGDNFKVTLKIVTGAYSLKLHGAGYKQATLESGDASPNLEGEHTVEGSYIQYVPNRLSLSLYGKIMDYRIDTENMVIRNLNSEEVGVISISKNEFIQPNNIYKEVDGTEKPAVKYLFENLLADYKNGKETATIRCSISDYYDYDTKEKVISIEGGGLPMKFNLYDEVIPMVYGYDGKDRPMSLYKDGTPKRFQVLGTKIYYDGAVWQELSLQEI